MKPHDRCDYRDTSVRRPRSFSDKEKAAYRKAFKKCANDFANDPSAHNWRALKLAMSALQRVMQGIEPLSLVIPSDIPEINHVAYN